MDDPSQYSIPRVAKSCLPIFLPWQREKKAIMSGFDSTALECPNGPWKAAFAFPGHTILSSNCRTRLETGLAHDVQAHTSSSSSTSETFSGRLSISVGNAVAKVGVTASYDQEMREMANVSSVQWSSMHGR